MDLLAEIFSYILQGIGFLIAGCIALFVAVILFGDEILWNFQLTGSSEAFAREKFRIKIKHTKKKGMFVEIRQQLKPEYQNKKITLFLNGQLIATIDHNQNTASAAPFNIPATIDKKPKKGQILLLKIEDADLALGRIS